MSPEASGPPLGPPATASAFPAGIPAVSHLFSPVLPDTLAVTGEEGHHLARVLRVGVGDSVTVADGEGAWRVYTVSGAAAGAVVLAAGTPVLREPRPPVGVAVAFALTKGEGPDVAVRQLTEVGVGRILPVVSRRSVARLDGPRAQAALVRWRRIAREAARQCRRARLPEVLAVGPLLELAGHPGLVVAERGGSPARLLGEPPGGEALVVVGPEGGLSGEERLALRPWASVELGPHVLRAGTAAVVAGALVVDATRRVLETTEDRSAGATAPISPVPGSSA